MKRGQVFTFAGTNAPRAGMTISETLFMSPEEHATIFSIAAGTDISEEFYPHPYLYLSLSGETRVEAPSLRVLPEGSALLIPQKTPFRVLAQDPCVFLEIEAKEGFCMNLIKTDEVFALKDLLPYEEGKIVNADIVNNPHMKMALMSFDAGCSVWRARASSPTRVCRTRCSRARASPSAPARCTRSPPSPGSK